MTKLARAREGSTARFEVRLHHDQRVPLRDGIVASADVYLPRANGPFPTVVQWTPYESSRDQNIDWAVWYAERASRQSSKTFEVGMNRKGSSPPITKTGRTLATPSIGLPARVGATAGSGHGVAATAPSCSGSSHP